MQSGRCLAARAPALGAGYRRFESFRPERKKTSAKSLVFLLYLVSDRPRSHAVGGRTASEAWPARNRTSRRLRASPPPQTEIPSLQKTDAHRIFHRTGKAIVLNVSGDEISFFLERSACVAHRNPEVACLNHLDIILSVTDADR